VAAVAQIGRGSASASQCYIDRTRFSGQETPLSAGHVSIGARVRIGDEFHRTTKARVSAATVSYLTAERQHS